MSQHAFSPDKNKVTTPKAWYEHALQKDGFIYDPAQAAAIEVLETLYKELIAFKEKRNRFLGRSFRSPNPPKGLYFWGGVGRGKSFFNGCIFFLCAIQEKT